MRRKATVELEGRKVEITEISLGEFRKIGEIMEQLANSQMHYLEAMEQTIKIGAPHVDPAGLGMSEAAAVYTAILRINDVKDILAPANEEQPGKKA